MKSSFIVLLIPFFMGCASLDNLFENPTGDNPPPPIGDVSGEADQVTENQAPPTELKPGVRNAISFVGDVAPVPWAGLAAAGIIQALTAYGSFRGRKWKRAASASVAAGNQFRKVVKEIKPDLYKDIKERIIGDQNADGSRALIKTVLNRIS